MDLNNPHPLATITNNSSLSMLEALIPFVEYPLKLPLALFIKFNEICLIMNVFRSRDSLCRLGLHNTQNSPMDMLCALTGMPPELMKTIFSMMDNQNGSFSPDILSGLTGTMPSDFTNLFQHATSPDKQYASAPQSDYNFDQNIQAILAEYDMIQAAEYDKQITNHYSVAEPDSSDIQSDNLNPEDTNLKDFAQNI